MSNTDNKSKKRKSSTLRKLKNTKVSLLTAGIVTICVASAAVIGSNHIMKRSHYLGGTILDKAYYGDNHDRGTFFRNVGVIGCPGEHIMDLESGIVYHVPSDKEENAKECDHYDADLSNVVPAYTQFSSEELEDGIAYSDLARHTNGK